MLLVFILAFAEVVAADAARFLDTQVGNAAAGTGDGLAAGHHAHGHAGHDQQHHDKNQKPDNHRNLHWPVHGPRSVLNHDGTLCLWCRLSSARMWRQGAVGAGKRTSKAGVVRV